eukprot:gene28394-34281_t
MSAQQAASALLTYSLDVLVDMNGNGLSTGLFILSYRPAVVQVSYLGDPYTTGADFVDYFLADAVVTPVEYTTQLFTEKLLILSNSYLVSSHIEWQSHLVQYSSPIPRTKFVSYLKPLGDYTRNSALQSSEDRVYFGSFHGPTKIDPTVFHIWMNILQFLPNGELVLLKMPNSSNSKDIVQQVLTDLPELSANIRRKYYNNNCTENRYLQLAYHGIDLSQVSYLPSLDWDKHLYVKSGFTMYLDTLFKNGHSTSVDATFAAIPIVALGGVLYNAGRSTESITHFANSNFGMVSSVKEYEDLVIRLTKTDKGKRVLARWREQLFAQRNSSLFFNVQYTAYDVINSFQGSIDAVTVNSRLDQLCSLNGRFCSARRRNSDQYLQLNGKSHFHIFAAGAKDQV